MWWLQINPVVIGTNDTKTGLAVTGQSIWVNRSEWPMLVGFFTTLPNIREA